MDRVQIISAELLKHGTVPGPQCHCGHKYRLGDSIADHRAEAIDVALTLHGAGITDTALTGASITTFKLTERR